MASPEEILTILETLVQAYPGQKYSRDTFQIYIRHLANMQPELLRRAVNNLINNSTWFPRVSEIRAEARQISGPIDVTDWEPYPYRPLMSIFYELEHDFFHHRILDPDAWLALAEEFDRRDRIYGAAATRRLTLFQQILAEEESVGQVWKPDYQGEP
jgi:hypothetical protein